MPPPVFFANISQNGGTENLKYLRTNQEYTLCANFDLQGQKARSLGQGTEIRYTIVSPWSGQSQMRTQGPASNLKVVLWAQF